MVKKFRDYIPTWFICMFFFFGVFIYPFIIGIVLIIIQNIQLKKIRDNKCGIIQNETSDKIITHYNNNFSEDKENIYINELKNKNEKISKMEGLIDKYESEIKILNIKLGKLKELKEKQEVIRLSAGKYKGNVDIPIGIYDLNVEKGQGDIEINKPESLYMNLSMINNEFGFTNSYKNIEISEKSIIKIDGNPLIRFTKKNDYDYAEEIKEEETLFNKQKSLYQKEIEELKEELIILTNDIIPKYYIFSNYENFTSQECKNKLLLLKHSEKDLRNNEDDIISNIYYDSSAFKIVRKILRTFNAECDNIMINVSLKNIDASRNKIQKSYETLNKMYSKDGVSISKKFLELKLEQITLMYTYELKYQQEKDIQKAIKEQMMEETKAQKEIEESKRKIEKDLQQHLGEINRLMKYMQKTQIDVEKQLYMDKINELEEKIQLLQSDKEKVLEREANARAGFVYIISNIGSFGENIYKIGMTRRLEPMDRIKELSSASVPFEFDVHAMIFSSDAPELENMLHKHFSDKSINKVNPRKEFFNVDIEEIEKVVKENYNDTVTFTKIPIASEYRQSLNLS